METVLSTLAFALLIGAQFLAPIVLSSRRKAIYVDAPASAHDQDPESATDEKIVAGSVPAKAA